MKGKHIAIPFFALIPLCSIITSFKLAEGMGLGIFLLWLFTTLFTLVFVISIVSFFVQEWDEELSDLTLEDYTDYIGLT